jgi:mono/diheme cytochrome c family protein
MPPLGVLPDDQIAAILTYVRRAWGHTASPVTPEEVKSIRTATAEHTDAWSPEELKQIP